MLEQEGSRDLAHSNLSKAMTSSRIPSCSGNLPSEMPSAGSGRGVASLPAVTCCHSSQTSLEAN